MLRKKINAEVFCEKLLKSEKLAQIKQGIMNIKSFLALPFFKKGKKEFFFS